MRVLIVDDEMMIRQLAERILRRAGHEPVSVSTGGEAIATMERAPGHFDVVILDLTLGDMSGRDCLDRLDKLCDDTPFIISTGNPVSREDFPADYQNHVDVLLKPYKAADLIDMVQRVCSTSN